MKYRYRLNSYTTLTAVLAVTLLFSSCEDERLDIPKTDSSEFICFASELTDITANVRTRSQSEHLLMESEDWPIEGTVHNVTRVAPTISLSGTAGVIAYKDAATSPVTELSDVSFTFDNEALASTGTPVPWSKVADASNLNVFSYAPYDVVHGVSPAATINTATASPTLNYTVPDAVGSQLDLIAASADVPSASFRTSVPLTYNHVLTAIRFKVDFACKVKSLSVNGVYKSGTYTIGGDWSGQTATQTYTFGEDLFTASGTTYAADAFLTTDEYTLMLLPQTVPAGATVVLNYSTDDGVTYQDLTASIAGHEWQKGKRLTYTISKSGISYVYFDLAAGPVSITASDYSGYVYVNGTATNVTGNSPSSQKYYVYQSTTVAGTNDKGHTGYASSGDFDAKANIRLPSYSELMSGGKTWSQFITNNSDIASVIEGWTTATSGSRTGTNNRIHIVGNVTVDMTLDNVWCSYHDNAGHRHTGGMLIGPASASPNGVRHEKVTLRLKGDNRFCNIYYFGHHPGDGSTANLHVTSAAGDGSYDGSLTVTVPTTDTVLEGACTVFGSGDNDDCPPCTDMYFDGGTIYVAGSILVKAGDSTGILGGGTNNNCDITINDANITAVAHSNGAAIGGGGGHSSNGGQGKVTITSGKVYAYQFGSYSGSDYLSTAAIGGGSSYSSPGSAGNVTITGGEVYAQSVGGAAIGGGSSRDVNGGNANVTITGGYVVAKSIAGTINGHSVTVSNAIGGGKGGNGATSGYGGSANLTISGGTLLSGSVGGGGTISETAPIGTAVVNISGTAVVQGQFIMAAGASTAPTFNMTGGTLRKSTSGVFQVVKSHGGAVYIEDGTFTMSGGNIRGFSVAGNGGAVYIEDGSFEMNGGTIDNCSATEGGAVYIKKTGSGSPSFSMSGSAVIRDCTSTDNGGAVYLEGGTVNITGGTIQENRSSASGGGVYVSDGSFTMSAGNLVGNYAQTYGGGVAVSSSESASAPLEVHITGGNIQENWTYQRGGGISVVPYEGKSATVILGVANQGHTNPDISRNGASMSGGGVYVKKSLVEGTTARLTINSGKIKDNIVSTLVDNPDVDNDGGLVTLNDGDVTHVVVTYHMNDGSIPETTATQKIVTSTRSVLNMPGWSITGYTLTWNTQADGSGVTYTNGQEVNLTTGLHLYAIWTPTP